MLGLRNGGQGDAVVEGKVHTINRRENNVGIEGKAMLWLKVGANKG